LLTSDLAVIGGGAVGLAAAWKAREQGLEVDLIDPTPGKGASWAAAGMLAPVTEVHYGEEALLRLNLRSAERYPSFVAELESRTGKNVGYRKSGTVMVARDSDENEQLGELWRFQQRLGLPSERLSSRECRGLEPALAPSVRGGIFVESDHQVDNRSLVGALLEACRKAGVRFHTEGLREVNVRGNRLHGIVLENGDEVSCGSVLVAAGAASGSIPGLPPAMIPVRPVKGQLLHLHGPLGSDVASHTVRGLDVYAVPRGDGRLVVGATVEERGFDKHVTAGAVYTLLRDVYELLPGIIELELRETAVGLRPGTPDNAPLIGRAEIEGVMCATGHYRNGILLTPITAEAIAEIVTGGDEPEYIRAFSPLRFQSRSGALT
jgi:glycine oxidase